MTKMADKIWDNTIMADERLELIPKIPDSISNPDASAEPTYPGAAGIR